MTGEVNRTWRFEDPSGHAHEVSLYHHTVTGARGAMMDFLELPDSIGTTSVLKSQSTIRFDAGGGWRGTIVIKRVGMMTFEYECVVGGKVIPESLSAKAPAAASDGEQFDVSILSPVNALFGESADASSTAVVTWYPVTVYRKSDGAATTVHRRFKDFADFDEAVQ